ncbi:hypothetical protein B8W67_18290 [Mycolicibacillus koreensis]|uniref:Uncharacterized protein n=1 Tax=Mycolicibacillus koreensis TaxID=1069220 RepID=A0AA91SQC0_9MYCO|nr:hypothetical protein B8W67_18290 [Mycolicibacillus koreensis]
MVSVVLVAVVCSVLMGLVLYAAAIVTHHGPQPTPVGDYVRLFILDITVWGPLALVALWYVSIPVIVTIGVVVSVMRRAPREP